MTSLYTLYIAMIIEGNLHQEMPTSVYIDDTVPGLVLNALRVVFAFVLLGTFAFGAIKAYSTANARAQQVQQSLMIFIFLVTLWLFAGPVVAAVAGYVAEDKREKTAVAM